VLAAGVFALHPVHVESVAWITEQKNTLSTVFYLGAALAYLRFEGERRPRDYALATALFVLGLLTKTVTATLPAALGVILWWQRGRLTWSREVRPLLPWFVLGAVAGLGTAWVERKLIGAEGVAFDLTFPQRLVLAGRAAWFYLGKLLWPHPLTFIYPRWTLNPLGALSWLAPAGLLAIALFCWRARHRGRGPLATLLLFVGTLFPVLGFLNVYPFIYSFVADHFQYLASLAPIACAAAGATHVCRRTRFAGRIAAIGLLAAFAGLVGRQSRIYHDRETLFRATLVHNPAAWMAHNNLGRELLNEKARLPEAIACFERAIALRADYFEAHNNLGLALSQTGRPHEALPHLEVAIRLKPRSPEAHNNLGIALVGAGRGEAAVGAFATAARLNPTLPNLRENWAKALRVVGRETEAAAQFAEAARLRAMR
jgi:protein O-mannosyl-transferase